MRGGHVRAFTAAGYYLADRAAQWRTQRQENRSWNSITDNASATAYVECQADAGIHGDGVNVTQALGRRRRNGPWTANAAQAIAWAESGEQCLCFLLARIT